jgi:hypothetical protein
MTNFSERISYTVKKCKKTNLQSSQIGKNILGLGHGSLKGRYCHYYYMEQRFGQKQ